jgi:AcrR family transcriptional regulator
MIGLGLAGPADDTDTRSRILGVAAALFGDRGYASTSLRVIAGAVGMTPPALYWYFPSKQAILHALLHRTLFDFIEAVEAEVVGPLPEDRLRQYVRAHVVKTLAQPRVMPYEAQFGIRQMARFLTAEAQADLNTEQRRHLDLLRDTLRDGIASGCFRELDVTLTAFAITSMCDQVASWWRPDGRISAQELADQYLDMVMRMVRPEAGGAG